MTTILIINAASSLVAALGIGGWYTHRSRRAKAAPQPVYVAADGTRRHPSR